MGGQVCDGEVEDNAYEETNVMSHFCWCGVNWISRVSVLPYRFTKCLRGLTLRLPESHAALPSCQDRSTHGELVLISGLRDLDRPTARPSLSSMVSSFQLLFPVCVSLLFTRTATSVARVVPVCGLISSLTTPPSAPPVLFENEPVHDRNTSRLQQRNKYIERQDHAPITPRWYFRPSFASAKLQDQAIVTSDGGEGVHWLQ